MSIKFTERVAQAQDLASVVIQDGEVSCQEIALRGISSAENAQKAAGRSLMALAHPLASLEIEADRSAWEFRPGTVFKLVWPPLGIDGMICRVVRIGTGRLDSGKISFEAMEDVFAVDWTGYSTPPVTGWVDPAMLSVPLLVAQVAMAAPYIAVGALPTPPTGFQRALVMATRGTPGITMGYNAYVGIEAPEGEEPPDEWYPPVVVPLLTPSGVLLSDLEPGFVASIAVSSMVDPELVGSVTVPEFGAGANVAWIEHEGVEEFIAFEVVEQEEGFILWNIARGCVDTAPSAFPAGTRIWFLSYGSEVVDIHGPVAPDTERVNAINFQPWNNGSEYPFNDLGFFPLTVYSPARADRVYCPTDVLFNDESYPSSISGELTVSWSHRNRLAEWSFADSGKTDTPEDGTEYDILVYGELDTLVHTETGVTGNTWTYLSADEIAESGLGRLNTHLRVVIKTYGDSRAHEAYREIEWEFDRV